MGGEGRVRTPGYLAFVWLVALTFSATGVGAVLEGHWSWPAVVVAVAPLLLAVRALRFGVEVTTDEVVITNLVRTRHLPRDDVTRVLPTGYDGFWTRGSPSWVFGAVAITAGGRQYVAYGLVGRRGAVLRAVDRLATLVGLPAAAPSRPRHSRDT